MWLFRRIIGLVSKVEPDQEVRCKSSASIIYERHCKQCPNRRAQTRRNKLKLNRTAGGQSCAENGCGCIPDAVPMDWSTSYYYILRRIARTYRNDSLSLRDTAPDERNNLSISETGLPCRLPFWWSFFILYTQANVVSILLPYLALSSRRAKTRGQRQPTSNEGGNTRTRRYHEMAQIRQLALPVEGIAALSHLAMVACGAPHDRHATDETKVCWQAKSVRRR